MENSKELSFLMVALEKKDLCRRPHQLSLVMASILRLLDGPTTTRLSALPFLDAILNTIPAQDLQRQGYLEVVFDILLKLTKLKDLQLLPRTFSSLLALLAVEQSLEAGSHNFGRTSKTDEAFVEMLKNLVLFSDHDTRSCLTTQVLIFMDFMGLQSAKYLPRLLTITEQFILTQVSWELDLAMSLFDCCVRNCWPLFGVCLEKVVLQLMKIVLISSTMKGSERPAKIENLMWKLRCVDDEKVRSYVEACLEKATFGEVFSTTMRRLTTFRGPSYGDRGENSVFYCQRWFSGSGGCEK